MQEDSSIAQAIAEASEKLIIEHVERTSALTQDPVIQLQHRELDIKKQGADRQDRELTLDEHKVDAEIKLEAAEIKRKANADKATADASLMESAVKATDSRQKSSQEDRKLASAERVEYTKREVEKEKIEAAKVDKAPKKS